MQLNIVPKDEYLSKEILKYAITEDKLQKFQEVLEEYQKNYQVAFSKDETEEHFKGIFNDFFKKAFSYSINTHKRIDSCIYHSDGSINSIIEVKRPFNQNEMIQEDDLNRKAFHEALLYFYEQYSSGVRTINNVIITDCQYLYFFKASIFQGLIEDKKLVNILKGFKDKSLELIQTTADLYNALSPILEDSDTEIETCQINLLDKPEDTGILYRFFDEYHLFRKPLSNDANALNRRFYNELLYVMGLQENKDLKLVSNEVKNSLLDLTQEVVKNKTPKVDIFETALSLNILWLNRILFLKLLESQLKTVRNNSKFSLLDPATSADPNVLYNLFFNVLNKPRDQRSKEDQETYQYIPYLNSSLFVSSSIEEKYDISSISGNRKIKVQSGSILGDKYSGKEMPMLEYLLSFLNCYQFNREEEGSDPNTVIKSSVLGLVFEKLNGYKDGSHFTPAVITMYMCEEAIHKQVIKKFNQAFKIECSTIIELERYIKNNCYKTEDREKAQKLIDSITVLDPAVGSGHFLVSSLNELITLKSRLGLLHDDIKVRIENDELLISYLNGKPFIYQIQEKEITPVQEEIQQLMFHTKKHIIENQLFGVDINPNSVNICRLRLWIELLKHSHFVDKQLIDMEALPNLEFKIITANSLLPLKEDNLFFGAEQKQKLRLKMKEYYNAITDVKEDIKDEVSELIETYKEDTANPQLEDYKPFDTMKINGFFDSGFMFGLDNFDLIIMNPPYIALQSIAKKNNPYQGAFNTYRSMGDIYQLFMEHAFNLAKDDGIVSAVVSNKWMRAGYGEGTRQWLYDNAYVHEVIDLGAGWFDSATVDTNIITYEKRGERPKQSEILAKSLGKPSKSISLAKETCQNTLITPPIDGSAWLILTPEERSILNKMNTKGKALKDWDVSINRGVLTGFNEAFIIDGATKDALIEADPKSAEIIKPLLRGRDIKRYGVEFADKWLINTHNGVKSVGIDRINIDDYPAIKKHLDNYLPQLEKRQDKGETPYNLRNCAYLQDFDKPKICWGNLTLEGNFAFVTNNEYIPAPANIMVSNTVNLKYLTGVLNSKLTTNFMRVFAYSRNGGYMEYKPVFVETIPIPVPTPEQEKEITQLVDKILAGKQAQADTSLLEAQIDTIVYNLYGLSDDEIRIIEGRG